ncbi:uncharacterized protein LOC112515069 [Cynara cardunculus var. scolymus]|uniref:uncharacterized protein LOC112515069 n=1 Tax=Cynara cardunculus var. scolymus TaxID=59895 RepID=UPI000D62A4A6|nr:uncharacterized protein LOC112515069 [Cynara cardunculus var. scolymus]XP_024977476.1 uncharacterized protein LOC112515069 [Cynara cardunculus var. scolymus]
MKTKRQGVENTTGIEEQHSKKQKLVERSSMCPPEHGTDNALLPSSPIDHELALVTATRFQAVPLVASPTYPNAVAWSNENLVAVASGHVVTILNPADLFGPKGLIIIPTGKPLPIGVIERKDLLSDCMMPICLSRDFRPCVRSISWSPLGLASNAGCLLAVCTTEGVVKVYRSPFHEFSTEWVEVMDLSEILLTYFAKIRYGEADVSSSDQGHNDDYPVANLGTRSKNRKQNIQENHNLSLIGAEQYSSRSAMLSSLVLAWSPMVHSNSSGSCSILAIGAKNGRISFWRVQEPECYSITQRSKPHVASLIGFIQAHNSWITAISWSKFVSDGSPQLLLSTGCSDGSVKVWQGYTNDLLKPTEDGHALFSELKEVIDGGSGPTSVLSLLVPDTSPHKIMLAVGKGSGSLEVSTYDMSTGEFDALSSHYAHDQIVTGLAWAYDGHCLYSCSQDNSLRSWIIKGDSLHEVPLPSNILGDRISIDVPNVSDGCSGIAVSPANLVVVAVRSFDTNLLNPMYQARSQKGAVEFFWIGGQKLGSLLQNDPDENFPGFPNMDLVNWGRNILWSLNQYKSLDKPLVLWDIIAALSAFKKSEVSYLERILVKWLISNLGFEWGPSLGTVLPHVCRHLSDLTSRQLHLLNVINRNVILREPKLDNVNGEEQGSDGEERKLWSKLLEMSEKELRERLIGCSFSATLNLSSRLPVKGYNGNWQPVGLSQMQRWVANNDHIVKDYVKLLASEVKKIEKRYVAEEDECSYCSAPVPFKDTEVAFCQADKIKQARCAVSMIVCPTSPTWICISCNRRVSNLAPESLFTLHRYPPSVDSVQNAQVLSKPLCPFCGILLQKQLPVYLLPTSPV